MSLIKARPARDSPLAGIERHNYLLSSTRQAPAFYDSKSTIKPEHDNDHAYFRDIRILPTADEILATTKKVYLPKKDHDCPNPIAVGPERHLDLLFRHMRHENIESINDIVYSAAQNAFLQSSTSNADDEQLLTISPVLSSSSFNSPDSSTLDRQETGAGNRYYVYKNARIEELIGHEQYGVLVRISYHCPKFMRGKLAADTGRFDEGMLIALLFLDRKTNEFFVHFLIVHQAQSTMSMDSRGGRGRKAAVEASPVPDATKEDILEFARLAQNLDAHIEICMVEFPRVLHAGFYHCLRRLQTMTGFAFADYLAPRRTPEEVLRANAARQFLADAPTFDCGLPEYAAQPGFHFNLGPVFEDNFDGATWYDSSDLAKKSTLDLLLGSSTLDAGQAVALQHSLLHAFAFTQGPPGTGKTYLGIQLTRVLLASRTASKPILVVCLTNHALDNFLEGLKDAGVTNMLRVGSSSKEEWTDEINLRQKAVKARNTPHEASVKNRQRARRDELVTNMQDWGRSASSQSLNGTTGWYAIDLVLAQTDPELHQQLKLTENPASQKFLFEHWASGGDVRQLRKLRAQLDADRTQVIPSEEDEASWNEILQGLCDITAPDYQDGDQLNIWKMTPSQRRQLLAHWQSQVDPQHLATLLAKDFEEYREAKSLLQEVKERKDVRVLEKASVIGITTTACASRWDVLYKLAVEVIICEEAGEVMEPQALCALLPTVQHAIFIGDPEQLRPEVSTQDLKLECRHEYRLNESLFERMIMPMDMSAGALDYEQLTIQRRMHPEIAEIARLKYPFLRDHASTYKREAPIGLVKRLAWWDHRELEEGETGTNKSHVNKHEVRMVTALVKYLLKGSGYAQGDIAVLTPYSGQLAALHKSLSSSCHVWLNEHDRQLLLAEADLEVDKSELRSKAEVSVSDMLRVTTVDNFQGEEAKIVILSTVRSGGKPGFLSIENRINVACSRAQNGFYIIGNSETLGQVPLWREVLKVVGPRCSPGLLAYCNNHPTHQTRAQYPEDFDKIIDCPAACGAKLDCGHTCELRCHPLALHEEDIIQCSQQCEKQLSCGHRCTRPCGVDCGPCTITISETTLNCGHEGDVLCSRETAQCSVVVATVVLPCGHSIDRICGDTGDLELECLVPCDAQLACGHECSGTCTSCQQNGHSACAGHCGRSLPCGHTCAATCSHENACPPCMQRVEVSCEHSSQSKVCHTSRSSSELCMRPQSASCAHVEDLQTACCLPWPVRPCAEPCVRVLSCSHMCQSLCGESCIPTKDCFVCNNNDASGQQRLLYVEECGHVVGLEEMDARNIQGVFVMNNTGQPAALGSPDLSRLKEPTCLCGQPCPSVQRYRLIRKLAAFRATFGRLFGRMLGEDLPHMSRKAAKREKHLDESYDLWKTMIRSDAVGSASNMRITPERLAGLEELRRDCLEYRNTTIQPFEEALRLLQERIPDFPPYKLTIGLHLETIVLRASAAINAECIRMGEHLITIQDPSFQTPRMGQVLLESAIRSATNETTKRLDDVVGGDVYLDSPALVAEVHLNQVHCWLIAESGLQMLSKNIDFNAVGGLGGQHNHDQIEGLFKALDQVTELGKSYPAICASFGKTASSYKVVLQLLKDGHGLAQFAKPDTKSARHIEARYRAYSGRETQFVVCAKGHPYSEDIFGKNSCPECGVLVRPDNDVYLDKSRHLYEDDFLAAMQVMETQRRASKTESISTDDNISKDMARVMGEVNGVYTRSTNGDSSGDISEVTKNKTEAEESNDVAVDQQQEVMFSESKVNGYISMNDDLFLQAMVERGMSFRKDGKRDSSPISLQSSEQESHDATGPESPAIHEERIEKGDDAQAMVEVNVTKPAGKGDGQNAKKAKANGVEISTVNSKVEAIDKTNEELFLEEMERMPRFAGRSVSS